ncbi:MAG: hypothetical protein HZB86_11185 [Deltaproteobacteria bacterium]|nr:hypothetical protein [Deltaproteobacteria bacterium]
MATQLFVWIVERTRCPVKAAWTAMEAVSRSRISPTMMMSGSCRRIDRSIVAKLRPIFSCTAIWLIPDSSYSIGSSIVVMFSSTDLILFRMP